MEFQVETGTFGLAFLLFIFGIFTLVLPALAVQLVPQRSAWLPFAIGFFLIALMVDVLCVTQLFDISLPHHNNFLTGLFDDWGGPLRGA